MSGGQQLIIDISARVKRQFCVLQHFSSSKPRKGSCFCKVPMGGALESENWGLLRFSIILEMGSLIAVLSARYFSAFHQLDSDKKLDLLRLSFYSYRLL